ncbi:MAG: hypothetical protein ACTSRT_14720 [Promethearchaeota archaeon]
MSKNLKHKIWEIMKDKRGNFDPLDDFELHMKEISRKEGYYSTIVNEIYY